jgi:hypothetical protein
MVVTAGQLTFLSHAHYMGSWVGPRTAVDVWRRQTFVQSDVNQTLASSSQYPSQREEHV